MVSSRGSWTSVSWIIDGWMSYHDFEVGIAVEHTLCSLRLKVYTEKSRLYHSDVIERGVLSGALATPSLKDKSGIKTYRNYFCTLKCSISSLQPTTTLTDTKQQPTLCIACFGIWLLQSGSIWLHVLNPGIEKRRQFFMGLKLQGKEGTQDGRSPVSNFI